MSTSVSAPAPDFGYAPPRPRRVLRKWSLALTAVFLIYLLWQCGSGLYQGRSLSNDAVNQFHQNLNAERYEAISASADDAFRNSGKEEDFKRLLQAIHRKLGDAGQTNMNNLSVNATAGGTFITAIYQTTFAKGSATETFTWKKSNGQIKLYQYNILSNAFIIN